MKATTYLLLLFGWATALAQGSLEVIDLPKLEEYFLELKLQA